MAAEVGVVDDPMRILREKVYMTYEEFVREPTNNTKRLHFEALDNMVGGRVAAPRRNPEPPAPATQLRFRSVSEATKDAREAAKIKSQGVLGRTRPG